MKSAIKRALKEVEVVAVSETIFAGPLKRDVL
jgi:hypothetical protein